MPNLALESAVSTRMSIVANEKEHHITYLTFILLDKPHNNDFTKASLFFKLKLPAPQNTQETGGGTLFFKPKTFFRLTSLYDPNFSAWYVSEGFDQLRPCPVQNCCQYIMFAAYIKQVWPKKESHPLIVNKSCCWETNHHKHRFQVSRLSGNRSAWLVGMREIKCKYFTALFLGITNNRWVCQVCSD